MRIAEIFRSRQGEGRLTGTESVFVRTSGCNLRCGYCDTPYASSCPVGEDLSVEEIVEQVRRQCGSRPHPSPLPEGEGTAYVVLTGGEPMLFAELVPLSQWLRDEGFHITVETAGTLYLPVACDLMSISPKLSNSTPAGEAGPRWAWRHEAHRHRPEVVRRLVAEWDYQVKFVVDAEADLPEVEAYLAELPKIDRRRAMLMPQGTDSQQLAAKAAWIEPYCTEHGLTFCPRRQIEWQKR